METNNDLISRYELMQHRIGLQPSTLRLRRWLIERLTLDGVDPVTATTDDLEQWLDRRNITTRTRRTYLALLAPFFDWLQTTGARDDNPTDRIIRPKVVALLPRPISTADLRHALAVAPPRMRAWLCLGAYQGFRCKEIAGLTSEAIIDDGPRPLILVESGKGGKQRLMPLHAETLAALEAAGLPKSGPVFKMRNATVPAGTISRYVSAFLHEHGINATAHQLRHWFGTHVYAASADLRVTQELMGHADPKTTALYTAWSNRIADSVVRGLTVEDDDAA